MRWQFESLLGQARWPPVRVAACLLAVAVAFVARLALVPWLGHEMAYVTFYPAVMVVATLAGFWLGVAATLVSTVLATTFVPGASFERPETHDAIALVAFVVTGLGVSLLAALYRRARSRLSELERRAALHDSEEVFRAFFHNAAVGTVQLDLDGRFLAVNDRYCEITGYSREELLAMTSLDLAPQEDRASRLQELQLLRQCGSRRFEAERRYVRKDGRVVWVRATGGVMRDIAGVPARIAGLVEDVTERREAEAARGRSELEFRTLADNIAQLAWMADEQGRVTWYSKRWYEYTGATPAETEDDVWTRVVHADHLPRVLETARGHMARGEAYEDTFLMRGSDGQYRWFLTRVVPVRDDSGRVVRWLGTSTDVTEQRDRELALRETDRRKNEFLAMLSHELRNPLAPIRSSLYVLDHSVRADQAQRAREIIERQVRHMTRLIDDLLDISRIARGKVRLSRERFDLAALVRRTAEDRAEVFARNGIAFAVSIGERPVFVDGDPTRIAQVVDNLLQNAAKFTPRGGHVSLELATDALGQAVLRVRDDGVGIAPEAVDRVFQPFVQAYGTVGRSQGGLGLGLALVRASWSCTTGR